MSTNRQGILGAVSAAPAAGIRVTRVKSVRVLPQHRAVYNITTRNHHVFFANGVLTHNCDALAWVGQLLLEFGIVNQKVVRKPSFRDKLARMARGSSSKSAMSA